LKTIRPSLEYVEEDGNVLRVGALTRLADLARSDVVRERYAALAEAAGRAASPQIREMGTIGGNISQLPQCWYFRKPDNRFPCKRKGASDTCFASSGDNRYHSIFGDINGCYAVNVSDVAPALIALDARIMTNRRSLRAEDLWDVRAPSSTVLDYDEIITEIRVPRPPEGSRSAFHKFALRSSIDFPIVNGAALVGPNAARVALNAVYGKPYRAVKAEEVVSGKPLPLDMATVEAAADAAVSDAKPMEHNKWKISVARAVVKQLLTAVAT
ncbi:MAG: FAD binding domain-containing protein, partial [Acidobacteriota bacterium]